MPLWYLSLFAGADFAMSNAAKVISELQAVMGERASSSPGVCQQHAEDMSHFPQYAPEGVVFPESTEEVQAVMRACAHHEVPVIPYGVGTSLEGHILAIAGGITVDLSRMNKVLAVNEADLDVRLEPGVTRRQLNSYIRDTGLFFPIDPGADATLGGMASTRASGTNAVRYGTMKENVLSLTVVLPDGNVITTARRARKSSAGYDLTSLFVGAEGTLGIITELTVRLYGLPEEMSSAFCCFPNLGNAVNAVIETIQMGIPVARIELMDEASLRAINAYSKTTFKERTTLLLEFHGSAVGAKDQVEQFSMIADAWGAEDFQWATLPEERSKLWRARHDAAHAIAAYAPGTKQWWTDVCVPISRLADCILETQEDIRQSGLVAPIIGHVGDGNFHVGICAREDSATEQEVAESLHHRMIHRALDMEGTCTGEHGIGMGKLEFLRAELGPAVDVMALIKNAIDPKHLMNPGKVIEFT